MSKKINLNMRFIGLILLMISSTAYSQTPAQDGQWSTPFSLPLIAIHSAMLPTGKVLLFSFEHGVPGIHGWLLDPNSLILSEVPPPEPWNPDCSGHSFLPDGRLLVAGGTLGFDPIRGPKSSFIFDPYTEQWIQIEDMRRGRWYPTNITLPDGSIITMSGLNDTDGDINPDIERWVLNGSNNWELLAQRTIPFYPYLHVLPSGLVFLSGPEQQTETFNPTTAVWTTVAMTNSSVRYEAPSVLLPPTLDRVMLIGGASGSGTAMNSVEIIDFSEPTPAWRVTAHMTTPRMEFNAVLLPDGKVFVAGGKSSNDGSPDVAVLIPEIFDANTELWEQVAPHSVPRMYHSTAILLPDARVLLAGADNQATGEIYSPSYLFRGTRPVISAGPARIEYGSDFSLEFTSSHSSNTVALIRLSSVTHSVNMGQRYVQLAEGVPSGSAVFIPAPATSNLAPPGFYMLFVVDDDGVPSISRIIQVVETLGDLNASGVVDIVDFAILASYWIDINCDLDNFWCNGADFARNGEVNPNDLAQFVAYWLIGAD